MSDEPPKKRRFWRIHLSSLLVLTFFAGGILSLNFMRRHDHECTHEMAIPTTANGQMFTWGWPFCFRRQVEVQFSDAVTAREYFGGYSIASISGNMVRFDFSEIGDNPVGAIVWNALIGLGMCTAIAVMLELFLRRREARKP
jgi:hypothetical protein